MLCLSFSLLLFIIERGWVQQVKFKELDQFPIKQDRGRSVIAEGVHESPAMAAPSSDGVNLKPSMPPSCSTSWISSVPLLSASTAKEGPPPCKIHRVHTARILQGEECPCAPTPPCKIRPTYTACILQGEGGTCVEHSDGRVVELPVAALRAHWARRAPVRYLVLTQSVCLTGKRPPNTFN